MPGRKLGEVPEESAPAVKEPERAPKVSEAKAEAEREKFGKAAGATGKPDKAMREQAVGPEAEGGKRDKGAAVDKNKDDGD
jgi:NADH-quinone oxidoreductase subunit E